MAIYIIETNRKPHRTESNVDLVSVQVPFRDEVQQVSTEYALGSSIYCVEDGSEWILDGNEWKEKISATAAVPVQKSNVIVDDTDTPNLGTLQVTCQYVSYKVNILINQLSYNKKQTGPKSTGQFGGFEVCFMLCSFG